MEEGSAMRCEELPLVMGDIDIEVRFPAILVKDEEQDFEDLYEQADVGYYICYCDEENGGECINKLLEKIEDLCPGYIEEAKKMLEKGKAGLIGSCQVYKPILDEDILYERTIWLLFGENDFKYTDYIW